MMMMDNNKLELNGKLIVACDYSGEIFENLIQLFKNRRLDNALNANNIKTKEFRINCYNCTLQFDSTIYNDGYRNIQKVMPGMESACEFCERNFLSKRFVHHFCYLCNNTSCIETCEKLVHHLKDVHQTKKPFSCIICGKAYNQVQGLKIHIRNHTGFKPYKCNICGTKYRCSSRLRKHQYTHMEKKQYECKICQIKLVSPSPLTLKLHLRLHENKAYECTFCERKFAKSFYLKKHLYTHLEEKLFECNICKKKFIAPYALKRHFKLVHEKHKGKIFKCDFCGKEFSQPAYLKVHKKYTHSQEKQFECKECKSTYSTPATLKRHLKIHEKKECTPFQEKILECNMCNSKYSNPYALKRHLLLHEQSLTEVYKCDFCEKEFAQLQYLKTHQKYTHSKEKQFACNICKNKYTTPATLKRHQKSHQQIINSNSSTNNNVI